MKKGDSLKKQDMILRFVVQNRVSMRGFSPGNATARRYYAL